MRLSRMLAIATLLLGPGVPASAQRTAKVPDPDPELERQALQPADGFEVNLFAADPLAGQAGRYGPIRLWGSLGFMAAVFAGGDVLGFFLVHSLFGTFNQRKNVAHPENARNDAVRMEWLERIVLFTNSDEFDRGSRDLPNRQRSATARVAVHLGEHYASERKLLVELLG